MRAGPERVVLREGGERTLICVPFAGGSARSFTKLARLLDDAWTVVAVQPPPAAAPNAPGTHGTSPPVDRAEEDADPLDALARRCLRHLADDLHGPGLLLGHSLGAAVAHRMAVILGDAWPREMTLVLSAPPAPGSPSAALLELDDRTLLDVGVARGMISVPRIAEDLALRMILPDFRRDLAVLRDGWRPVPVAAHTALLGGSRDPVCTPAVLAAVGRAVDAAGCRTIDAEHLYVVDEPAATAEALRAVDVDARSARAARVRGA